MKIEEIKFADINLVKIHNRTPHCVVHGAMNKLNTLEDGGGYWRCITVVSKNVERVCQACCRTIKL